MRIVSTAHVFALSALLMLAATPARAEISIAPYAGVTGTKKIKPAEAGKESSENKQRTVYGIKGTLGIFKLLKVQASIGQSKLVTVTKTQDAVDDFDEIDYQKDADVSTDDPESELKVTEVMNQGKVGVVLDPGFWIFILRAKAGVAGMQRIVTVEETGKEAVTTKPPIKYKPYAGAGAGIKLSPKIFAMMEYELFFYKYPELEPFAREVSVSFGVTM